MGMEYLRGHRLESDLPDPVESRRSGASRVVRLGYAALVLGLFAFFLIQFAKPLLILEGPGVISANGRIVSLPYVAQITEMKATAGQRVEEGAIIARVRSPQFAETVTNLLKSLVDVGSREADLRIRAAVAAATRDATAERLAGAEAAVARLGSDDRVGWSASLSYRAEALRERAIALQAHSALEAEAREIRLQLDKLAEIRKRIEDQLRRSETDFADGVVHAPTGGIVSAGLSRPGETVMAGGQIAEVFESERYVDWYLPSFRIFDPEPGQRVFIHFGTHVIPAIVKDVLPISRLVQDRGAPLLREAKSGQMARLSLARSDGEGLPLESQVVIRMNYLPLMDRLVGQARDRS
jgi:multidrug resistance efflux pump